MKKKTVMMMFLGLSVLLTPLSALQLSHKGKSDANMAIFHPPTGLCVRWTPFKSNIKLGSCTDSYQWYYSPPKNLEAVGTYFCIEVVGLGKPVKLDIMCQESNHKWDVVYDSKSYLLSKTSSGEAVCLDIDSNNTIVTTACKCLNSDSSCDPLSQWFKIVQDTRVGN